MRLIFLADGPSATARGKVRSGGTAFHSRAPALLSRNSTAVDSIPWRSNPWRTARTAGAGSPCAKTATADPQPHTNTAPPPGLPPQHYMQPPPLLPHPPPPTPPQPPPSPAPHR